MLSTLIQTSHHFKDSSSKVKKFLENGNGYSRTIEGSQLSRHSAIVRKPPSLKKDLEDLVIQSANKKDYQTFKQLILIKDQAELTQMKENTEIKKNSYCLGLILLRLAHFEEKYSDFYLLLYLQALFQFKGKAPRKILIKAARAEMRFSDWKKAEGFYEQALMPISEIDVKIGGRLTKVCNDVEDFALVKIILKKWQEAEEIYTQFFSKIEKLKIEAEEFAWWLAWQKYNLAELANIKINLHKFEEAEELFERATSPDDKSWEKLILIFTRLAWVKINLNKEKEAKFFFKKVLLDFYLYATGLSDEEWKEMERYYTQILSNYKGQASVEVFAIVALIKNKLEKWEEAKELYAEALSKYEDQAPAIVLAVYAQVKMKLNKLKEAEELYTQALFKYGDKAPEFILVNYAILKANLNRSKEAKELLSYISSSMQ